MNAPQIIRTPAGEELVLLSRADYDALMARLVEAEEDLADISIYDQAKARIASGAEQILSRDESAAFLGRGAVVRAFRKERDLSQADLAKAAGVSQAYLSKVERGAVGMSGETRRRVAEALGVDPATLG